MKSDRRWVRWLRKGYRILCASIRLAADRLRRRRVLLWEIQVPAQLACVKPVLQILSRNPRISSYIVTLPDLPAIPELRPAFAWDDLKWLLPADLFISLTQYTQGIPRRVQQSVLIPHGLPSKGNSVIEATLSFDHLFLTGPILRELFDAFVQSRPGLRPGTQLHEAGYPRSDVLFQQAGLRPRAPHGSPPIVLFAPSFEPRTSLDTHGEKPIDALLELPVRVEIKLHPMHHQPRWQEACGRNWPRELKEKYVSHPNVRFIENDDSLDAVVRADVLVTDVSGVALEYILADRGPGVYIDCPDFYRRTLPEMFGIVWNDAENDDRVNVGRNAGLVTGLAGLTEAVRLALADPDLKRDLRRQYARRLIYHPGSAAERYAQLITEITETLHG